MLCLLLQWLIATEFLLAYGALRSAGGVAKGWAATPWLSGEIQNPSITQCIGRSWTKFWCRIFFEQHCRELTNNFIITSDREVMFLYALVRVSVCGHDYEKTTGRFIMKFSRLVRNCMWMSPLNFGNDWLKTQGNIRQFLVSPLLSIGCWNLFLCENSNHSIVMNCSYMPT